MEAEVVRDLCIRADGCYVDGTYGRGGHAQAILQRLNADGRLHVFDRDPTAIRHAQATLGQDSRVHICAGEFARLLEFVAADSVDGILLDLGVSSPQLDDAERGFSFLHDGPLDMRMNHDNGMTAAEFLASATVPELVRVLNLYGEERFALKIANAIVSARELAPLSRTHQLADLVSQTIPRRFHGRNKHPATRTFQAIRIWINAELEQLKAGLTAAFAALKSQGRLAVISFHSLEDRQVKNFMRDLSLEDERWRGLPNIPKSAQPRARLIGRAQRATPAEVLINPRARSAVLRVAERLS